MSPPLAKVLAFPGASLFAQRGTGAWFILHNKMLLATVHNIVLLLPP
jgi:hypothetical protein